MGRHSVPLVVYTRDGMRHVIGEAEVDRDPISQEMRAVGKLNADVDHVVSGMFSLGFDEETD